MTPRFDKLCVGFLAIEWIFFGSMHFSLLDETVRQIPNWIPAKEFVAVLTGFLEVGTGIMILVPAARRWAALSSLILLVLLLPAMYHILADPSAVSGPPAWRIFFKTLLLPNNILMALCSFHLWHNPSQSPPGYGEIVEGALARSRSHDGQHATNVPPRWWPTSTQRATVLVAFLLLVANCAGFLAVWASDIYDHQTAYLWSMMCIALGAFIGFLFAVPRLNRDAVRSAALLPNTNIEQVSDWLSKIIVGVGLINLKEIGVFIDTTSKSLAESIGSTPPFAMALILYFFVAGLIQGYLLTRMFLAWQFEVQVANARSDGPG